MPTSANHLLLEHKTDLVRSYIRNLNNASESGNVTAALLWLGQLNTLVTMNGTDFTSKLRKQRDTDVDIQPLTIDTVKFIFYSCWKENNEEDQMVTYESHHSALYTAAINGHYKLVEYYLSLYLVYALKITFSNIHISQSFRTWFFGGSANIGNYLLSYFNASDYDQCVLQSNEPKVLEVMMKKKIDIPFAMKVVDQGRMTCFPYRELILPRMSLIYANVKDLTEKGKVLNKDLDCDDEDNSILSLTDKCCGMGIDTRNCVNVGIRDQKWSFVSINHHEIEDNMVAIEIILQKAKLK